MRFQSPGLECEIPTRQRVLRLAITVGMAAAQGLINAVILVLALSGLGVQGRAAGIARQEERVPHQQDKETPELQELDLEGLVNIEAIATSKKEEDLSQAAADYVLKAIRQ